MNIAILGGGFTGLSATHYLQRKGHTVTLFEKEKELGGLAVGFKAPHWKWYLERTYHHLFSNDHDILDFASEIKFENVFYQFPITASLYQENNNYRIIPVDTPQDFLKFPLLSLPVKLRAAMVLAFLKVSPFFTYYEQHTAEEFLKKTQGEEAWNVLWHELFRKKFGKYAENILASFIWARIKKRTKKLAYIKGGFQELITHAEKIIAIEGATLQKGTVVEEIEKKGRGFEVRYDDGKKKTGDFDAVISTLPTPIMVKVLGNLFPDEYREKFSSIKYLHASNLILETKEKLLDIEYWLSVCVPELPMMVAVQQTNFIDSQFYGGNNILYVGNYIDKDSPLLKMDEKEAVKFFMPHLQKINKKFKTVLNAYYFKAPFAQPIFDKEFVKAKPEFVTPVKNLFIANLDMTYPYDRGTNYAVKLGKDVANLF